jgi:hypothetical protein
MLAMALTLVPLPLLAADGATTTPPQPLKSSIAAHAKHEVLVSSPTAKRTTSTAVQTSTRKQTNDPRQPGFFRSPAGIACIAVLAVGTSYALYSASHDRIHSVARQNQ